MTPAWAGFVILAWTVATPLSAPGPQAFRTALVGTWNGTLEYRDYRSDRRVTLPTSLTIADAADTLEFAYVYDDGPGKTVRSRERITIAADGSTYRIQNESGTYDATFAATGLAEYGPGTETVVLTGTGTENDQPVDLRLSVTVNATQLTILRESRLAGGQWLFRNQYRLQRQK